MLPAKAEPAAVARDTEGRGDMEFGDDLAALIARTAAGDRGAFRMLYERQSAKLYAVRAPDHPSGSPRRRRRARRVSSGLAQTPPASTRPVAARRHGS